MTRFTLLFGMSKLGLATANVTQHPMSHCVEYSSNLPEQHHCWCRCSHSICADLQCSHEHNNSWHASSGGLAGLISPTESVCRIANCLACKCHRLCTQRKAWPHEMLLHFFWKCSQLPLFWAVMVQRELCIRKGETSSGVCSNLPL